MIYLHNGILRNNVEQTANVDNNMNKYQKKYVEKNQPDPKEYILYDSILYRLIYGVRNQNNGFL